MDGQNWSENDHNEFYKRIRNYSKEDCSKAILSQAEELIKVSNGSNHDLLKAAESMMIYWTMNSACEEHREEAYALLHDIYQELEEPEKARKFR